MRNIFLINSMALFFILDLPAASCNEPFVWISANAEGLAQHLLQYVDLRNYVVHKCHRKLMISPYLNKYHNADLGNKHIILCDYFVFPTDTLCLADHPKKIVQTYSCVTPCNGSWECAPVGYGLRHCNNFTQCNVAEREIDFCKDSCGLIYGHVPKTEFSFFKIDFQNEYYDLRNKIKGIMNINKLSTDYTAVHWRRGDQLTERCGTIDKSVNCKTSRELIEKIRQKSGGNKLVYIATNEKNITELNQLTAAGYYTWHRLNVTMKLDSVQIFVIELMLMIEAQTFLHWGHSGVSKVVLRMKDYHQNFS